MAACGGGQPEEKDSEQPKKSPFSADQLAKAGKQLKDVDTDDSAAKSSLNSALLAKAVTGGNVKLKEVPDNKKQHKDAPKTNPADYVEADKAADKK